MSKRSKRILDLVNSTRTQPDPEFSSIPEYDECLDDLMSDVFNESGRILKEVGVNMAEKNNLTPIPSPVAAHEDPCKNDVCAICVEACEVRPEEVYFNLPKPSTITATSTNETPTTQESSRKKIHKTEKGKKRLLHKERWCVVQRKKMRNEGKAYTNKKGKQIAEKVLGQPCGKKCRYKCTENYDLKQREVIFTKFWKLGNRNKHWEFVIKHTKKINKGRNTTEITKHKREYTYVYFLPTADNELKRVCKEMFLSTISSGERIITTAWKKYDGKAVVEEDKRGKYEHKPRVIDDAMVQSVKDHVNCLDRVDSHNARKDSEKLYLNDIKSTSQMYKLYLEWYDHNTYINQAKKRQYRDIVNANFNLAFHKPKKDSCEVCLTEEEKQSFMEHQERKKKVRSLKQADKTEVCKNPEIVAATFDFQKVLLAPHGEEPVESAEDEAATTQEQSPDVEHMTIEGTLEPNSDPLQDIKSEEPPNDSYVEDGELNDLRSSNPPSSSGLQSTRKQKKVINRRKRPYESEFSNVIQRLESTVSQVVNSTSNRPEVSVQSEDEFHIFALSVAAQLRQLPLHVAITTQSKIQSMLSEARLASIFLNSSTPSISTVKTEQASDE